MKSFVIIHSFTLIILRIFMKQFFITIMLFIRYYFACASGKHSVILMSSTLKLSNKITLYNNVPSLTIHKLTVLPSYLIHNAICIVQYLVLIIKNDKLVLQK